MKLSNVGPIKCADITFGDLTVLVGPQASGKSIALQFLKLLLDKGRVHQQLTDHGIDWGHDQTKFLDAYFGEGMHAIWQSDSRVDSDGKEKFMASMARRGRADVSEHVFMIPAQRVLAVRNGWPRNFSDYVPGDPFAVREFSETLRTLVEKEFATEILFPQKNRLKEEIRNLLEEHVFGGFSLCVNKVASQKRLVLSQQGAEPLPHMVWSAGQREFVPLLLGLYWLMPPAKVAMRDNIKWVVLEELEMGLHPRAINVVLLMVLDLLKRGYRVCVSTHSTQVLEAVWAIQQLKESEADAASLLEMFHCPPTPPMRKIAQAVLKKNYRVHYFDRESRTSLDISRLDPGATSESEAAWGGLAEFSAGANQAVADAVSARGSRR